MTALVNWWADRRCRHRASWGAGRCVLRRQHGSFHYYDPARGKYGRAWVGHR